MKKFCLLAVALVIAIAVTACNITEPQEPDSSGTTDTPAEVADSTESSDTPDTADSQPTESESDTTEPTETDPPATEPTETDPPATEPTETDPPATEPTETDPPATEPTETDPPATEPTETDPPATEPTETDPPATEPTETDPPETEPTMEGYDGQFTPDDSGAVDSEADVLENSEPPVMTILAPEHPGIMTEYNSQAIIDYSNAAEGYIMVQYTEDTKAKLKARVHKNTTYTYNLTAGEWVAFPLSEGDGEYEVTIYVNVVDSKYATALSAHFNVKLNNEFAPFLYSNQYVDYASAPNTAVLAKEVIGGEHDVIKQVARVYDWVVSNITYDKKKASSVKSGYLPVLDNVIAERKGICFDYAALMAGMLRSYGIPTRLVVGYAGDAYHAWIDVWSEETGWVDGAVFFNGNSWQRMDPTFASSGNRSDSINKYIGDGSNYRSKYIY